MEVYLEGCSLEHAFYNFERAGTRSQVAVMQEVLLPYVFVAGNAFPLQTSIMKPFGRTDLKYEKTCVQ